MELTSVYTLIGLLSYGSAAITILARLFHPKGPNLIIALCFGCLAILMHSLLLAHQMFVLTTINFNLANVISLVALLISIAVSLLALKYKVNLLLPVVYGFSSLWLLIEFLVHPSSLIPLAADKLLLLSHITIALIAYSILVIATLYAFQVSYINFKLKSKNLSAVSHLPPLMQVERQLFFILALGTFFLLFTEISGFVFLENIFSKENAHKTVLSLMALIIYGITLRGHYVSGWRGHKVLVLLVIATSLLTLAYFGSRFVKEFLLA